MTRAPAVPLATAALLLTLGLAACSSNDNGGVIVPPAPTAPTTTVPATPST